MLIFGTFKQPCLKSLLLFILNLATVVRQRRVNTEYAYRVNVIRDRVQLGDVLCSVAAMRQILGLDNFCLRFINSLDLVLR